MENNFNSALSDFVFQSKYAKYRPDLRRKETFEESVDRISQMHIQHLTEEYPLSINNAEFVNDYLEAIEAYKNKLAYGSQRALQFGGTPILRKHCRIYNCAFCYMDSLDRFKEIEWVLLCGSGVGCSVEAQHINKLPSMIEELNSESEEFVISDSIEGWSLAIQELINYYFVPGTKYPKFDYSQIRPKGAPITGGFLAPGSDGLKNSIRKIEELLNKVYKNNPDKRLRAIDIADIIAFEADSVLSGGLRRSAVSILFDPDDEEMLKAKIGNWYYENPQRGRYNASAVLERGETNREVFDKIFKSTKEFGEPGFVWRSDKRQGFNPCFEIGFNPTDSLGNTGWQFCVAGNTKLITKDGIHNIEDCIDSEIEIWNGEQWSKVTPYQTGENDKLYRVTFSDGSYLDATNNHKFLARLDNKKPYEEYTTLELLNLLQYYKGKIYIPRPEISTYNDGIEEPMAYEYGFFLGDGFMHHNGANPRVVIYKKSSKINLEFKHYDKGTENDEIITYHFRKGDRDFCSSLKDESKELDSKIFTWNKKSILEFIAGWADADGSKAGKGIRIYGHYNKISLLQLLLTKVGIPSSLNLMSEKGSETNKGIRKNDVWYIQITKTKGIPCKRLECNNEELYGKSKYVSIKEIQELPGLHKSYCLTEERLHQCTFNNVLTKQCNLSIISGKNIETEEDFYKACKAAATLGTIQATYNKFPFLGEVTERIVKEDPLIGVSISGIMTNPDILLNENILRKGAEIVKNQNEKIAKILGINPASRTTTVKPDGNFGAMTGNTSGCHGEHAPMYIRRVQVNKDEEAGQIYAKYNPRSVKESIWSNNHTDNCIMFPITAKEGSIFKEELKGTAQLDVVRTLQDSWVREGKRDKFSTIENNVSNTVQVPNDSWDIVADYIWDYQDDIAGISFIGEFGELDYNQPAYSTVLTPQELLDKYGEGIIFASGLIVDATDIFGDLWKACDTFKGVGEKIFSTLDDAEEFIRNFDIARKEDYLDKPLKDWIEVNNSQYSKWIELLTEIGYSEEFAEQLLDSDVEIPLTEIQKYLDKEMYNTVDKLSEKRDLIRRMQKYADKYFDGEISTMIEALKYVQLYHDWCDITKYYQPVDWESVKWKKVTLDADTIAAASCSGGACEITKL